MNFGHMRVILGASSLKAYVAAPKAFRVVGLVRFGQEFGLLATNASGEFFRVNGSQIAPLDSMEVRHAIDVTYGVGGRLACSAAHHGLKEYHSAAASTGAVQITFRKHRQLQTQPVNTFSAL